MSDVHILAIDLAKRSFQVCGTDRVRLRARPPFELTGAVRDCAYGRP